MPTENEDGRRADRARIYILRVRNMIRLGLKPELALFMVLLELGWRDPKKPQDERG